MKTALKYIPGLGFSCVEEDDDYALWKRTDRIHLSIGAESILQSEDELVRHPHLDRESISIVTFFLVYSGDFREYILSYETSDRRKKKLLTMREPTDEIISMLIRGVYVKLMKELVGASES